MDIKLEAALNQDALIKPQGAEPRLALLGRPMPGPGEALVRVICTGLCRTDLLVAAGKIAAAKDDIVLGHEFCGIVEDVVDHDARYIGLTVAVDPTFTREDGSDGFMGRETDGCIATWAVVPVDRLFPVPEGMTPQEAAYLEPVAAAMGGVDAAVAIAEGRCPSGTRGVLVGSNRIATLTAMLIRNAELDFEHITHEELRERVRSGEAVNRWDWMIESGLTEDLCELAAEALRARGTLILKSRHRAVAAFPAIRWAEKQLNLAGRSRSDFGSAMHWLSEHAADVRPLLGAAYRLSDWQAAFRDANGGENGKTFVVSPGAEHLFPELAAPAAVEG